MFALWITEAGTHIRDFTIKMKHLSIATGSLACSQERKPDYTMPFYTRVRCKGRSSSKDKCQTNSQVYENTTDTLIWQHRCAQFCFN